MSEVARLRKRIELECEAMQRAMEGYAAVSKHEVIQNRYSNIGAIQQELAEAVGEKKALEIAVEAYYISVIGCCNPSNGSKV